jgi:hypothetical protein
VGKLQQVAEFSDFSRFLFLLFEGGMARELMLLSNGYITMHGIPPSFLPSPSPCVLEALQRLKPMCLPNKRQQLTTIHSCAEMHSDCQMRLVLFLRFYLFVWCFAGHASLVSSGIKPSEGKLSLTRGTTTPIMLLPCHCYRGNA